MRSLWSATPRDRPGHPAAPKGTRDAHFRAANENLFDQMDSNPDFDENIRRLIPDIDSVRGTADAPDNWVWNHRTSEPGVMELVPAVQHWSPNPLWSLFHPKINGRNVGGFKVWGHLF